ncbi:unnamed protein product [Calypogeia fissa]
MGTAEPIKGSTMEAKKRRRSRKKNRSGNNDINNMDTHDKEKVIALQLICAASVVAGLWILPRWLGFDLIQHPVETLKILVGLALPISLNAFALVPLKPRNKVVPVWWAIVRGLSSLPVGVLFAVFLAIVFGAPLPPEYAAKTFCWATLMSVLVVVPGATVLGSSWPSWHRIFACTDPIGPVEIAICIPAHAAAIGTWIGAWPMPLDWERPWQEWPVCCTYGAVGGYLVGVFGSVIWIFFNLGHIRKKQD